MRLALPFLLAATLPTAALADYSTHKVQNAFVNAPCGDFMHAIDLDKDALIPETGLLDVESWEPLIAAMAQEALYFGQVLGFDAAHGGLHTETMTTLARLRAACELSPATPAAEILRGFVNP